MTTNTYAAEQIGSLKTYDEVMNELSATESVSSTTVRSDGTSRVQFDLAEDFADQLESATSGSDVIAGIRMVSDGQAYQLTKDAFGRALYLIGLRTIYAGKSPSYLTQANLNYHWNNYGVKGDQVTMITNGGQVLDMTSDSRTVFSTYQVVDAVATAISERTGISTHDFKFDYKHELSFARSALRLIIPDTHKTIKAVRHGAQTEDIWSTGVQITNSMVGDTATPLQVSGYLFAWWCTNGSITQHAQSPKYTRRAVGTDWSVVEGWLKDSAAGVIDALPAEMNKVESLTQINMADQMADSTREVLAGFGIPASARQSVWDGLANSDDLSAYGLMQVVTQAANDPDLTDARATRIMASGGGLVHAMVDRCDSCNRII